MSHDALSLIGISKRFRTGVRGCSASVRALHAIGLRVRLGDVLGVTGASGAGKSTLLLCAAGLLRPDTGTVLWFGAPHRARGGVCRLAYVPAQPVYYPFLTVRDVLDAYGAPSGTSTRERHQRMRWAIGAAALEEHLHERVGTGPPSRCKQLALALALAARPRLLLLDDTLTGLGVRALATITLTLGALSARGTAVVITARCAEALPGVATRRMTFMDGTLIEAPPPAAVHVASAELSHRAAPARVAEGGVT